MSVIEVKNLTKDYGHNRGIFNIDLSIEKGVVYGFLGPNGAGKTTTIRHIMGFSKPEVGTVYVNNKSCFENASEIQRTLGYLPGEVALPENLTGEQFIKHMAELRKIEDMGHTDYLIEKFELDPKGSLKRMSLGMKRKLAIVTAFMHDPDILVLDEPTSGLDPVMQDVFIEFVLEEKSRGKTILLSSHIFKEIDATCDIISIIKDGKLVSTFDADELRNNNRNHFEIQVTDLYSYEQIINEFKTANFELEVSEQENTFSVIFVDGLYSKFIEICCKYNILYLLEIKFTLEDYFMNFYDKNQEV